MASAAALRDAAVRQTANKRTGPVTRIAVTFFEFNGC